MGPLEGYPADPRRPAGDYRARALALALALALAALGKEAGAMSDVGDAE
jgi:hypothetical protein